MSFDAKVKIKLIKAIKDHMGLGLKESKEFVDGIPAVLNKSAPMAEAEELKEKFKDLAVVEFF